MAFFDKILKAMKLSDEEFDEEYEDEDIEDGNVDFSGNKTYSSREMNRDVTTKKRYVRQYIIFPFLFIF